jgi:hypothetical protein
VREKIKEKEKRYACVNSATPSYVALFTNESQIQFTFDLHNRIRDFLINLLTILA